MTDDRDPVSARLASLAGRTEGIVASAALTARLVALPDSPSSDGFLVSIARLGIPSLALATAISLGVFVVDTNDEVSFDDDVASAVTMDVMP